MRRRAERGQAIVLIAAAMLAMVGIVAMAIDGGRIYFDRRQLQAAADAAALAAADTYQTSPTPDFSTALPVGAELFAENVGLDHIDGSISGTVGSFSGGAYQLRIAFVTPAHGSPVFEATASHGLGMTMMQVLGFGTVDVGAEAWANTRGGGGRTAVLALSNNGCDNNKYAVSLSGGSTANIYGDVASDGAIKATSNGGTITVDGTVGYACGDTPAQLPQAIQSGAVADPAYVLPGLSHYAASRPQLGTNAVLQPGLYPSDPGLAGGARCYFLSSGIYDWAAGYTDNGGFVSNYLEPPDQPAAPQLWNTNALCAGSVYLEAPTVQSNALAPGTWGVEVTTLREDAFWTLAGQTSAVRESSVSSCKTQVVGPGQGLQVGISNVPGAQAYSIYLSATGCNGPFGLAQTVTSPAPQDNSGSCPADLTNAVSSWPAAGRVGQSATDSHGTCRLGYVIAPIIGGSSWSTPTGATCPPPGSILNPRSLGCAPPSDTADRANLNFCVDGGGNLAAGCPGSASPGAVVFYFPQGSRINVEGGGATRIYSGMQFANLVLYAVGPGTDSINGGASTQFTGLLYLPKRDLVINGGSGDLIVGSLVANTLTFSGGATINIRYNAQYLPPPPGARLVR